MSTRSRALIVLVVAALMPACGNVRLPGIGAWTAGVAGRPVALLMEGSALTAAPVRERTALAVECALGRAVQVVERLSPKEQDTKPLVTRISADRSLARYEWREPQCASERTLLFAVTRGIDAIYHANVHYSVRERPATDAEWEDFQGLRSGFRRIHERPTVREELLTGTVSRQGFVLTDATKQASLYRRRVTLVSDTKRIDAAAAIADTVRELGSVPAPEWNELSERLLKRGCPFLAWAVADVHLTAGARDSVQAAAVAGMRADLGRRVARKAGTVRELRKPIAAARAPAEEPAEEPVDEPADEPAPPAEVAAAPAVSCATLCEMHMIEICNSDKVLWSAHRARWEPTRCGTRREEPFLAQCYREQWDTGTFETSCVQPCEASDAGRTRLMAILQEAGCVAGPAPS